MSPYWQLFTALKALGLKGVADAWGRRLRVLMTGLTPVAGPEMSGYFGIVRDISFEDAFANMVGFTEDEVSGARHL
jgi:hypothetical protein